MLSLKSTFALLNSTRIQNVHKMISSALNLILAFNALRMHYAKRMAKWSVRVVSFFKTESVLKMKL